MEAYESQCKLPSRTHSEAHHPPVPHLTLTPMRGLRLCYMESRSFVPLLTTVDYERKLLVSFSSLGITQVLQSVLKYIRASAAMRSNDGSQLCTGNEKFSSHVPGPHSSAPPTPFFVF